MDSSVVDCVTKNNQVAAVPEEQSVTFTSSGNNFVYSDNPESFSVQRNTLQYLWGASVGTTYKDIEMYHNLYNGDSSTAQLRAGIAIYNSNSTPVTITYKSAGGSLNLSPGGSGDASASSVTTSVLKSFFEASTRTVTVPAYGKVYLCGVTTNFAVGYYKFVSVRAQLKASKNSNVYFRVFVAGANKVNAITELFNITSPAPANGPQFCGEIPYTKKIVSLNALSNYSYRFFGRKNVNTNEYGVITHKEGGLLHLDGNYGVQYTLNISNTSGKNIWVVPDWSISGRKTATIVYRMNGGTWVARSPINKGQGWYLSLGTSSSFVFDMLLPGGNYGNYLVYFS